MACSAFTRMLRIACWSIRSSPRTGGRRSGCRRTTSILRSARLARRLVSTREMRPSTVSRRCTVRRTPENTSRLRTILAARSASCRIATQVGPLACVGRGSQQQLDVAEDALQRVVDLVGDAGDELAERRKLLGLGQPGLQRLTFRFQTPRFRDVASDDHATHVRHVDAGQGRHRHDHGAAERAAGERAAAGPSGGRPRHGRFRRHFGGAADPRARSRFRRWMPAAPRTAHHWPSAGARRRSSGRPRCAGR